MTRLLRVVTLASSQGRYGGPFDTASRQAGIAAELGFVTVLLAGHLPGDRPSTESSDSFTKRFVSVRPIISKNKFFDLISLRFLKELHAQVRKSDVIHISFSRELIPIFALLTALLMRKRCVVQSHGMLTSRDSSAHRILDCALRPLVRKASSIIALTDVEAAALRRWSRDENLPTLTLGNPVPADLPKDVRYKPVSSEAVFIARLHKRKRVDVFLTAAERASRRHPILRYVVVGPDGGCLESVKAARGRLSNVSYEGAMSSDEVTARVLKAGVFVLTSEGEPWGNVLAIALASGVPVVVPSSAALSSAVETYNAGLVVQDGAPDQVADAVYALLTAPDLYAASSAGALNLASELLSSTHQRRVLNDLYNQN